MPRDQHGQDGSAAPAAVQLNHTAVYATDRHLSAEFLATVLGLEVGAPLKKAR